MNEIVPPEPVDSLSDDSVKRDFLTAKGPLWKRAFEKFGLAAINAIPWVGGFIAAAIETGRGASAEDEIVRKWIAAHAEKMKLLEQALRDVADRLSQFPDEVAERIESPEYLKLVHKGFQTWDQASTDEKRDYVRRLLANAAATAICTDDLVRLFLQWLSLYDETHFKVIRAVYDKRGMTRRSIWLSMHSSIPRDDSSEADLFKLLIDDLTLGHVLRQERQTNAFGQFVKQTRGPSNPSHTMKSAFDNEKRYELTDLGEKFVHYVMEEVAPQIGAP